MRCVRRIECAAEKPDAHAGRVGGQNKPGSVGSLCNGSTRQRELAIHGGRIQSPPHTSADRNSRHVAAEETKITAAFVRCHGSGT